MASTRIADHIGRVLGDRYRLVGAIGTGASAHVFLADDVRLRRRVAVKILHPALAGDESFLKRFRAEAQAAANLNHPNIMAVYDWGEDDDGPYLVCEFLGGGSLRTMLDHGTRLTPAQALSVGLEAAKGLEYAHRRGLVHRDIKPANLLFDDDGRLRIADFGLARALAEAAWTEPVGAVLGTARYASPEQVRGGAVDGKADVYALALVLVEAVTGQVPFSADTTVATLMGRVGRPIEPPPELGPLGPVVARAGRAEPEERVDAGAMASALQATALELPKPARLPLAGTAAVADLTAASTRDPTEIGIVATIAARAKPTGRPQRAAGEAPLAPGSMPSDPTVAVAAPDPTLLQARPGDQAPAADDDRELLLSPASRRRRRWPLVVLLVCLIAGISGAAAIVVVSNRIPTHLVAPVVAMEEARATGSLKAQNFKVEVRREFSEATARGVVQSQTPNPDVRLAEGQVVTLVVSDGPPPAPVPDLANLTQAQARTEIEKVGHKLGKITTAASEDVRVGLVLDWSHKGESPPKGTDIDLVVSAGPPKRLVPDDLIGRVFDSVEQKLRNLGLVAVRADAFNNDDETKGQVVGVAPASGQQVERGSRVAVTVSKGQPTVPNVIGLTFAGASAKLSESGLKSAGPFGLNLTGKVFTTIPAPGSKVKAGSVVSLYV